MVNFMYNEMCANCWCLIVDEKFIVRHRALNPDDSGLTKDKNEIPLEIRIMGEGAVEVEARL